MKTICRIVIGLLCCLGITISGNAQKNKKQDLPAIKNVKQSDRQFWVQTLYKISYPVIHHLAAGTLKKMMPVQKGDHYHLVAEEVTYLEAIGRTMAGIAPWLETGPKDSSEEGLLRTRLNNELLIGLSNAVDPDNPDYLNFEKGNQAIVDAAYIAHAFLRAPNTIWQPLDSITKSRFIQKFKSLRNRSPYYNNWLLFAALTETFLMSIGEEYDPARIEFALRKMKEWYIGDGWYKDGEKFSIDYYNSFVIHPMLVDILKERNKLGLTSKDELDLAYKRMVRYSEFLERNISPEGTFPLYGRSVTYRSGVFQALAQVALMQKLPEHIKPGQVRAALTAVLKNLFQGSQNFDKNNWLILGFNGNQSNLADHYTSTGSLYMATLAFLPLGLPASSPFWSDPSADWSAKKAWSGNEIHKDYKVDY
ncbi:DUF2264 domain-containing protein [Polluticaenibacter yanchengensis]|uniref:DUF2264 domain-containing protein n=1 Tax=Polluticaenibacter yanchengensis TaxID=3014562 RepID=A0ABT4UET0_9BACT|nr:DUF2264 domain-containing protein [Chitinophagaceae bacterium LY-5]